MKHTITCKCENEIEVNVPDRVEIPENSAKENEILEGEFLPVKCERCGSVLKPELPCRFVDGKRNLDIYLVPERDRNSFMLGKYDYPESSRIVVGYHELVERLRLARQHLDPRAVEILKYQILVRAGGGADISIRFAEQENEALLFHIHGLKDDEIAVIRVPHKAYKQALRDADAKAGEEPYSTILEPPYVSINKIELEPDDDEIRNEEPSSET